MCISFGCNVCQVYVIVEYRFNILVELVYYYFIYFDGLVIIFLYLVLKRQKFIVFGFSLELDRWEIERIEIVMKYRLGQ